MLALFVAVFLNVSMRVELISILINIYLYLSDKRNKLLLTLIILIDFNENSHLPIQCSIFNHFSLSQSVSEDNPCCSAFTRLNISSVIHLIIKSKHTTITYPFIRVFCSPGLTIQICLFQLNTKESACPITDHLHFFDEQQPRDHLAVDLFWKHKAS